MGKTLQRELCRIQNRLEKMNMGGSYLVTGAGGNIGKYLVLILLENPQIHVIALVHHYSEELKAFWRVSERSNLTVIVGDVCDTNLEIDCDIDYIFHLAGIVNNAMCVEYPRRVLEVSIKGTENVLQLSRRHKVRKFCNFSSASVYGRPINNVGKAAEADRFGLDFSDISNAYAIGKQVGEMLCASYERDFQLPILSVRPYHLITPEILLDSGSMLGDFYKAITNNEAIVLRTGGKQKRNLLYVFDAIEIILYIFFMNDIKTVNIGNPRGTHTVREIADIMSKIGREEYRNTIEVRIKNKEFKWASNGYDLDPDLKLMSSIVLEYEYVDIMEAIRRCIQMLNDRKHV